MSGSAVRVLVVDDSPVMQKLLVAMVNNDARLEVVGVASTGAECVEKAVALKPHVIMLDLEMPNLSGPDTILQLSARNLDVSVLMLCDFDQRESPSLQVALERGAFDFFVKPKSALEIDKYQRQVVTKVFVAFLSSNRQIPKGGTGPAPAAAPATTPARHRSRRYTVIGCSTGGKQSLLALLPQLTERCQTAILVIVQQPPFIVQHFLKDLQAASKIPVTLWTPNAPLAPRTVLIAPASDHDITLVRFTEQGQEVVRAVAVDSETQIGHHPSLDVLFSSAANAMRLDCMGVVLSGTGRDGVLGLKAIQRAGGVTLAEDKATATVSQLSMEAQAANVIDETLPIKAIAERLNTP